MTKTCSTFHSHDATHASATLVILPLPAYAYSMHQHAGIPEHITPSNTVSRVGDGDYMGIFESFGPMISALLPSLQCSWASHVIDALPHAEKARAPRYVKMLLTHANKGRYYQLSPILATPAARETAQKYRELPIAHTPATATYFMH